MSQSITVLVFAKLQAELGIAQDRLDFIEAETAEGVFTRLSQKYDCSLSKQGVRVAVNEDFVPWSTIISAEDTVAFIPPVAGG